MRAYASLDRVGSGSRIGPWLQFAFAMALGLNMGGALLASVAIFPVWSASAEAAVAWRGLVDEARFFVVASPIAALLAVATLIGSRWAAPECRVWIRLAAILFLGFFVVTLAYFVPGQAALQGDSGAPLAPQELGSMLRRWTALNWVRQGLGLLAFASALHALGLSYAARSRGSALRRSAATSG